MRPLELVQVVAFLVAFTAQGSRLLVASRPFWGQFPGWVQTLLPPAVPTVAALAQGLSGVHTWSDLTLLFVACAGLLLPGLPSNRSAAKLEAGRTPTLSPSDSDVAVANSLIRSGSLAPGPLAPGPA